MTTPADPKGAPGAAPRWFRVENSRCEWCNKNTETAYYYVPEDRGPACHLNHTCVDCARIIVALLVPSTGTEATAAREAALGEAIGVVEDWQERWSRHSGEGEGALSQAADALRALLATPAGAQGQEQPAPLRLPIVYQPECVEAWPGCYDGGYDPRCCRFPKSCSCEVYVPRGRGRGGRASTVTRPQPQPLRRRPVGGDVMARKTNTDRCGVCKNGRCERHEADLAEPPTPTPAAEVGWAIRRHDGAWLEHERWTTDWRLRIVGGRDFMRQVMLDLRHGMSKDSMRLVRITRRAR